MNNIRMHLIIEGRVQGVWFRDSTCREAVTLDVAAKVQRVHETPEEWGGEFKSFDVIY
jgi:acylphosphatase